MPEEAPYFFNFLPKLYEALKKEKQEKKVLDEVESFLRQSFDQDLKSKTRRFLEIPSIGIIPTNKEYFKLYYELTQLYINGLYYSTIVLSGVLCERICYDILLKEKMSVKDTPLTEEQIACLFEMNLAYLFKLLYDWRLIKKETHDDMWAINRKRNEYVHPKKRQLMAQKDALKMIKRVTKILVNEFEVSLSEVRL